LIVAGGNQSHHQQYNNPCIFHNIILKFWSWLPETLKYWKVRYRRW
jgi:hypothetical protein